MPRRFSLVVILCEDRQQECFVYRYLRHKGLSRHSIRVRKAPSGKGAAEQYVRREYPSEVMTLRARSGSSAGLVAVIDADGLSVEDRLNQLAASLNDASQPPRQPQEPIALLIPKRNIETWIHHLLGQSVNEDDQYPKFFDEQRKCEPAARAFAERCPNNLDDAPPSLQAGCVELVHLLR